MLTAGHHSHALFWLSTLEEFETSCIEIKAGPQSCWLLDDATVHAKGYV